MQGEKRESSKKKMDTYAVCPDYTHKQIQIKRAIISLNSSFF